MTFGEPKGKVAKVHLNADFWYGAMVVVPVLVACAPFVKRGFREWRNERLLMRGHKGDPDLGGTNAVLIVDALKAP